MGVVCVLVAFVVHMICEVLQLSISNSNIEVQVILNLINNNLADLDLNIPRVN